MRHPLRALAVAAVMALSAVTPATADTGIVELVYETLGPITGPVSPVQPGELPVEAEIVIVKELGKAPVVAVLPSQDWSVPEAWDCNVEPDASSIVVTCDPEAAPYPATGWFCASPWVLVDHTVGAPGDTAVSGSTECGGEGVQSCTPLTVPGFCEDSDGLPAQLPSFRCAAAFDGSLVARAAHAWVVTCVTTDP